MTSDDMTSGDMTSGDMTSGDMTSGDMTSGDMMSSDMMGSGDMMSDMMSGMMSGDMSGYGHPYNEDLQSEIEKFIESSDYYKNPYSNGEIFDHYGYKKDDNTEAEVEEMMSGMMSGAMTSGDMASDGMASDGMASDGMASDDMASGDMMSDEPHKHGYGLDFKFDPYAELNLPHEFSHGDDVFSKDKDEAAAEDTEETEGTDEAAEDDDFEVDIDGDKADEEEGSSDTEGDDGASMDESHKPHFGYANEFHAPTKPNGPEKPVIDSTYELLPDETKNGIYSDSFKDTVKSIADDIKMEQVYQPTEPS